MIAAEPMLHLPRDYHHRDLFVSAFGKTGRLRLARKT
jgi:hypothetical protein